LAITLREAEKLELAYGDGHRIFAMIDSSSTVLPWLAALRLRDDKKRISLMLLPDMMDTESWRILSVLLRSIRSNH
jgi:hypothetical protein